MTTPGVTPGAGTVFTAAFIPRDVRILRAAAESRPTSLGSLTGGGPALSVTRTLEPSSTLVPADGLWAIAVPILAWLK